MEPAPCYGAQSWSAGRHASHAGRRVLHRAGLDP